MLTDTMAIITLVLSLFTAFFAGWSCGYGRCKDEFMDNKIREWEDEWEKLEEDEDFELD